MRQTVLENFSSLLGRFLMSIIFILAGLNKIGSYEATQGYMQSMGIPAILLPLVIGLELGGGTLLLIGFKARLIAFLLAGFTLLSAIIFHADFSDQTQMIMFMKNLAISGGLLFIVAYGPGKLSIDRE